MKNPVVAWMMGIASQLRFPWLLALTVGLLLFDLVIPDLVPFLDEILLSLAALVLASFRKPRRQEAPAPAPAPRESPPVIDVEPVRDGSEESAESR